MINEIDFFAFFLNNLDFCGYLCMLSMRVWFVWVLPIKACQSWYLVTEQNTRSGIYAFLIVWSEQKQSLKYKLGLSILFPIPVTITPSDVSKYAKSNVLQYFGRTWGTIRQFRLLLPRSWRLRITLDCEMTSSHDTLRILPAGFVEVVKVTNHTGLWDTQLS